MNWRNLLTLPAITALGLALLPGSAVSQQKSLKDQLIGMWTVVSVYDEYQDGKRNHTFGNAVKGSFTFESSGRFSQMIIGEPRPELKSNDPRRPDAYVVAYYGTYTVNEADKSVSYKIESAAFSPRAAGEFKNIMTISGDTLSYVGSPRKDQIGTFTPHVELKRAK